MSNEAPFRRGWRRRELLAAGCASLLGTAAAAAASAFPTRALTLIVPYPPGGSNDIFARLIGAQLSQSLRQTVVVENRPGAGGLIGLGALARAPADGHTLALVSSSFTTSAAVQQHLPFDPLKDFEPVARINSNALLILASPRLGLRTLQEFIAQARGRPGQVSYGSSGVGSVNHFAAALFAAAAGVRLIHIPYRGMAPALADLAGGNVDMVITSPSSAQAFLANARVVPLATTGPERMPGLPGIPTCREAGLPGFSLDAWAGFLVPGRTPPERVELLNAAINEAMGTADVAKALALDGSVFTPLSAADFKRLVHEDLARWRAVAKAQNIRAE
jgi:tripartite-type tricarboxylate transporter receptor subunit TctC